MSLADNAAHRTEWQRRAETVIDQINELRREVDVALRQQPPTDTAWRLAAADLSLDEARSQIRQAIAKVYQIV